MSGYGNSRHARRAKPMSKATQCAEELQKVFDIGTLEPCPDIPTVFYPAITGHIAEIIRLLYPEEEGCTYQKDTETNSLRMIDEGRDV